MTINDYARWRVALALTESNNNEHAWGDAGLAVGRFQMHPAFVWDYGPDAVHVHSSWDDVFEETLRSFYMSQLAEPDPVKAVMRFHLGVAAVDNNGQWDEAYAERFKRFYDNKV